MLSTLSAMQTGDSAPICLATERRDLTSVVLMSAISTSRIIVIPHSFHPEVLAAASQSTGAEYAIADPGIELPPGLRAIDPAEFSLSLESALIVAELNAKAAQEHTVDTPFCQLFTGGSTGQPKVWSKTTLNLLGEATILTRLFGISPEDRILATVPVQHIYGLLFSVFVPYHSHAGVVAETPYYPGEIQNLLDQHKCTILVSSPAHYKAMAAAPPRCESLRLAFSSGGFLDEADGDAFAAATGIGITEVYGSTETGGIATRNRMAGERYWTPLPSVDCDTKGERLAVKSPMLSPELPLTGDGFYITGDRGANVGDVRFELLGRVDGVVKVGGKRVVLESIKDRLQALPEVTDVEVISSPDDSARQSRIAAIVVTSLPEADLRDAARNVLQPVEMPRLWRTVAVIPRHGSGKPDRVELVKITKGD